jgi:5,10-methylenetetrahydromethanopterin reductase
MRFGLRIPACESVNAVTDLIADAEEGGFDYAWLPDTQLLNREVWVTLGAAAARTSKIILGTNVTNPLTRHATITAAAAATTDELSSGRFVLGIGSGESSVRVMGWKTAKLDQMREYIEVMRRLWQGDWVAPHGPSFHLQYATGRPLPVYIAATRPKMLQLAGEIADGVIMVTGISKESLDYGLTNVEIGARRAGRRLEDVDIATGVYCHIGDDHRASMREARPFAALYALRYRGSERDFGVTIPDGFGISSLYPDVLHAEDWQQAIRATEWVPDDVLQAFSDEFCLLGSGEQIAEGVRRLASYGVNNLYIRGFYTYDLPTHICRAFVDDVIPRIGGGRGRPRSKRP